MPSNSTSDSSAHVVVRLVLLRGGVQVEARADAKIVGVRLLVGHLVAPGRRVGHHEHHLVVAGRLERARLLAEVLVRAGEPREPVDHGQLLRLRDVGQVSGKNRLGVAQAPVYLKR